MKLISRYKALIIGPFLFLLIQLLDLSLEDKQQTFLSIFALVVCNWLFTKVPLYVTGFLGISLSIIFKISTPAIIFGSFGHPIIFLFLAGFLLALAFNKVGLDKRIALYLLTRSFINGSMNRLLLTLLVLTSVFTMWISNTATTAMMLPLVLGVLKNLNIKNPKTVSVFLISIAYASSIGGIATPIGSPPNIIAIGLLEETIKMKITFLEWMIYAFPLTIAFLSILYLITKFFIRSEIVCIDNSFLLKEYQQLGAISKAEKITGSLFGLTVFFWILPSITKILGLNLNINLNSGAIGLFFASILFLIPSSGEARVLKAQDIKTIDWSSLMLFGAGLAFGKLLFDLGLAQIAGNYITNLVSDLPLFLVLIVLFSFVVFSTELTSNTATANILIPIMISLGISLNIDPFLLSFGVALSCSLAFMLPVATPPNTIVYGTELVEKSDMISFGLILNIVFSLLLAVFIYAYSTII